MRSAADRSPAPPPRSVLQAPTTLLGMVDLFSGGNLQRLTVFALGIMPYISASIIMQLCTVVVPSLEALKKEGEAGRRKITQYTRYATLGLAFFQALGISIALEAQAGLVIAPGFTFRMVSAVTLVTGSRDEARDAVDEALTGLKSSGTWPKASCASRRVMRAMKAAIIPPAGSAATRLTPPPPPN